MKRAQEHLVQATEARSYMKAQVDKAKQEIKNASLASPLGVCHPPCTKDITIHYFFDFAQQVVNRYCSKELTLAAVTFLRSTYLKITSSQVPSISWFPGSVEFSGSFVRPFPTRQVVFVWEYFLCDYYSCLQVNYLIDEGMNVGKGANCIISFLHHYLQNNSFGEANLCLHADNCCGQNKNR